MADEDAYSSDGGGEEAKVNIWRHSEMNFSIRATLNTTVGKFKSVISQHCDIPAEHQRLIYKGRIMKDDQTLQSYGVEDDQKVYLSQVSAPSGTTYSPPTNYRLKAGIGRSESGIVRSKSVIGRSKSGPRLLKSYENIEQLKELIEDPKHVEYIFSIPDVQNLFNDPKTVCNKLVSKQQIDDSVDSEDAKILTDHDTILLIWDLIQREMTKYDEMVHDFKAMNMSNIGHEDATPLPNTIPLPNHWAFAAGINSGSLDDPTFNKMIDSRDSEGSPDSMLALTASDKYPEDPIVMKTIGDMLHDDQYLIQMFDFAPSLQNVLDSDPWIRHVMQHPEFIRLLASPPAVNALLIYHRAVKNQATEDATKSHDGQTGEDEVTAAGALERLTKLFIQLASCAGIFKFGSESTPQDPHQE